MQKAFWLLALLGMMLGGCGVDWFPDTTVVADFAFSPASVTGVAVGSTQTSSSVTLSVTGDSASISVSGDASSQYSVNGAGYTKTAGTVKNGDRVTVQHTASSIPGQTVTTTLTVGAKSASFASTTSSASSVAVFSFPGSPLFEVAPGVTRTSEPALIAISGGTAAISVSGDASSEYSVNGAAFTKTAATATNGDQVMVRHVTADGVNQTTVTTTLTVGDKSASFITTTGKFASATLELSGAVDETVTGQVILRIVPGNYTLAVASGDGAYSLDGVDYTTDPQTVALTDGTPLWLLGFANAVGQPVATTVISIDGVPAITLKVQPTQ